MQMLRLQSQTSRGSRLPSSSSSEESDFDIWATHKSLAHKKQKQDNETDELTYYLNSPNLSSLSTSPHQVWNELKSVYPTLYQMAKKYVFILGTSVPAERLFSKAGRLLLKETVF